MLRSIVIMVALYALTISAFGDGWYKETVDSSENVGRESSIVLDSNNRPHIAYFDYTNSNLKYANWNGTEWDITTVDDYGNVGEHLDFDLDSSDSPHFVYKDGSPSYHDLKYAYWNGSAWNTSRIDTSDIVGWHPSIEIDSNDLLHISYQHYDDGILKYAYSYGSGSSWTITEVDTGIYTIEEQSIALDSNNEPCIAYRSSSQGLKYAYLDGSTWEFEVIDSAGYTGAPRALAVDSSDYPHIAYRFNVSSSDRGLRYAYEDASGWHIDTIDENPPDFIGFGASVALDSQDYSHVLYINATDKDLKYAYWNGSTWQISTLESADDVNHGTSIVIDNTDTLHISYYNETLGDLIYAWFNVAPSDFNLLSPSNGVTVNEPVTLDWEDADDAQTVTYDVWYSTDPTFATYEEITGLTDSTYTFNVGDLNDPETYYWKVRASDGYEDTWSGPDDYWSFTVNSDPSAFNLLSPTDGSTVFEPVVLDWEDSAKAKSNTDDESLSVKSTKAITYDVWYSEETDFDPHAEVNDLTVSTYTFEVGDLDDLTTYYWKVRAWDGYDETWSGPDDYWSFHVDNSSGINGGNFNIPTTFALHPAVPNPSSGTATIGFALPSTCEVELSLFEVKGRRITTLVEGTYQPGEYSATVNGLSSGVYIYKITADGFGESKKMVVK